MCFFYWCVGCGSGVFITVGQWMLVPVWYKEFLVVWILLLMMNFKDKCIGFTQTVVV